MSDLYLYKKNENGNIIKSVAKKVDFEECIFVDEKQLKVVFDFSYNMTFGKVGEHRNHRTEGRHFRKNGEIFANTFQGKICECLLYQYLIDNGVDANDITGIDFSMSKLGNWDSYDIKIKDKIIAVKSTKSIGNLLLLECSDWDKNGRYTPNIDVEYAFIVLIRLKPIVEEKLKQHKLLYSNECDRDELFDIVNDKYCADMPRCISLDGLKYIINNDFIIKQGEFLNSSKNTMDVNNYYIQFANMQPIDKMLEKMGY